MTLSSIVLFLFTIDKQQSHLDVASKTNAKMYATNVINLIDENKMYLSTLSKTLQHKLENESYTDTFLKNAVNNKSYLLSLLVVDNNDFISYSTEENLIHTKISSIYGLDKNEDTYISPSYWCTHYEKKINLIVSPIKDTDNNIVSYLIGTYSLNDYIDKKEVPINILNNNSDTEVIYEVTTAINEDFLSSSNSFTLFNDWKVYYEEKKLESNYVIITLICCFAFSLGIFHLLYFFLLYQSAEKGSIQRNQEQVMNQLQLYSEFAASTAHEIKNPLTAINGFITLLYDKCDDFLYKESYKKMQKNLDEIHTITSYLLKSGKPHNKRQERILLQDILQHVIEILKTEATHKNLDIQFVKVDNLLYTDANYNEIIHAFYNIYEHTIDLAESNSIVYVSLTKTTKNKARICFCTENHIKPSSIFPNISKHIGDHLSLTISEKLLSKNNGTFQIFINKKKGKLIQIMLPLC